MITNHINPAIDKLIKELKQDSYSVNDIEYHDDNETITLDVTDQFGWDYYWQYQYDPSDDTYN